MDTIEDIKYTFKLQEVQAIHIMDNYTCTIKD
jgi:hypothetical protein